MSDDRRAALEVAAAQALAALFAHIIRVELDDSPDHSGAEDVARAFAQQWVELGTIRLAAKDWRDPGAFIPGSRR